MDHWTEPPVHLTIGPLVHWSFLQNVFPSVSLSVTPLHKLQFFAAIEVERFADDAWFYPINLDIYLWQTDGLKEEREREMK